MATIGFFGLGSMGLPMAKRLIAAGHALRVAVHRNRAPADKLAALGATVVATPAEVVQGAEVVVSILPEDQQIRDVLLAPDVMESVAPGCTILEMSTAFSATARAVAEAYAGKEVSVLDAPVSGGVSGAEKGTLTIMCGGDAAVFEAAQPILQCMGTTIRLVGGMGAGKDVKLVNQVMGGANTAIVAEGLNLARKLGLDLDIVYDMVSASSGQSTQFDNRFKRMRDEAFAGGFKTSLMMKDMRLALHEAAGLPMPMTTLAYQLFSMTDEADRDLDFSAITRIYQ